MPSIEFKADAARAAIREAKALLADMTPIFQDVQEYMVEVTRKRFSTGTAPDGSAWAKKSEATIARYKALGYGALRRPLIGPGRRLSREISGVSTREGAVIGSSLIYSRVMQEGAERGAFGTNSRGRPIPWGRIPARVWLGISAQDEREIVAIAEEHIQSKLDGGQP